MSKEFYKYIAKRIIAYFRDSLDTLRPGERFCLRLDNEEMVEGVDEALRTTLSDEDILGTLYFSDFYSTYTIKLSADREIVVAPKVNGMTDAFMATLRNAKMTDKRFPILMITTSTIDTISSGTGDLASKGMPFHAENIIQSIKSDIDSSQLSQVDSLLLTSELNSKECDEYSDKSSLFEYGDLLTVLARGYVIDSDYIAFSMLPDSECTTIAAPKKDKILKRFDDNRQLFKKVDSAYKNGNISELLEKEFDTSFIKEIETRRNKNQDWYDNYKFIDLKKSQEKLSKKLDNPLVILDEDINVSLNDGAGTSEKATFYLKCDGDTNAKRRKKNLIIFNPDGKQKVEIQIKTNIAVKSAAVYCASGTSSVAGKIVTIKIDAKGAVFNYVTITDTTNNIDYVIRVAVFDVSEKYLSDIKTKFILRVRKSLKNSCVGIFGIEDHLLINYDPTQSESSFELKNKMTYVCQYNETLKLTLNTDDINPDDGCLYCDLTIGLITIPLVIIDEPNKPEELTGARAFKKKYETKRGFEYSDDRISFDTFEFFVKEPFRTHLQYESMLVNNGWHAMKVTNDTICEYKLEISQELETAYIKYTEALKAAKTIPSLVYLENDLLAVANEYIQAFENELSSIADGQILSKEQSNMLLLGSVFDSSSEEIIMMSPLNPLNVLYQIELLFESDIGLIRDDLVYKLNPLGLLPYVRDCNKILYKGVEQKSSPEWRVYAQLTNKKYQGTRNYVQKLTCEKIEQYKKNFPFLFDDLGHNTLNINLINMGDCSEILSGIIKFYSAEIAKGVTFDKATRFSISIYANRNEKNAFSVLSNNRKLRELLTGSVADEKLTDFCLLLSSNIRCFYKNIDDKEYSYAHLTFYEMPLSNEQSVSVMSDIITGTALGGLTSGVPSVLSDTWYKTGFGTKFADDTRLVKFASKCNAIVNVAFTGSSFFHKSGRFTELEKNQEERLNKIYNSSNWVVFVDPKVDLSFFKKVASTDDELMIIHYSDQYTSSNGYDDITVTQKTEQYGDIIKSQLEKKGIDTDRSDITGVISLFNAINGSWLLKLISTQKVAGALESNFSREKMSILSAIKLSMAYYDHPEIVWVPVSLEELIRVSGGAGYSAKDGLLSSKNLGFENGVACDDILLVGFEGPKDNIKLYIHPVEVKIGQNPNAVIQKAKEQVGNTYKGLVNALWPDENYERLENKLSRNFFIQVVISCCEKMKLYGVYSNENWDLIINDFRQNLLNERYTFSESINNYIGKGTVVSFTSDSLVVSGEMDDNSNICWIDLPEKLGYEFIVESTENIISQFDPDDDTIPVRLCNLVRSLADLDIDSNEDKVESTEDSIAVTTAAVSESNTEAECESISNIDAKKHEDAVSPEENVANNNQFPICVNFGVDISNGESIIWRPNDTTQLFHTNTGIIGTMGTGKTQFTKSLVSQLYRERNKNIGSGDLGILIFDYKGDYNESKHDFVTYTNAKIIKPYHIPFNPLALIEPNTFKPLLPIHIANAFKDTISKIYGLGAKQQNTLFTHIIEAYESHGIYPDNKDTWKKIPPTFESVYRLYDNNEEIKKNDSLNAAMDKLHQFQIFETDASKTVSLFEMLKGVVVIDLSGYDPDIQSLIVAITLDLFYAQMQASGSSLMQNEYREITKMILVDEADNFMSEGFPSLKKILKEGREFGVGTILSTQFLKHFGTGEDDYSKYILTWVVHNVADLKLSDVEFVFKTESKSEQSQRLFNEIKQLQKHHSVIKIGNSAPKHIRDKAFWELYKEEE